MFCYEHKSEQYQSLGFVASLCFAQSNFSGCILLFQWQQWYSRDQYSRMFMVFPCYNEPYECADLSTPSGVVRKMVANLISAKWKICIFFNAVFVSMVFSFYLQLDYLKFFLVFSTSAELPIAATSISSSTPKTSSYNQHFNEQL